MKINTIQCVQFNLRDVWLIYTWYIQIYIWNILKYKKIFTKEISQKYIRMRNTKRKWGKCSFFKRLENTKV
mgnify:CR=1 FL=1